MLGDFPKVRGWQCAVSNRSVSVFQYTFEDSNDFIFSRVYIAPYSSSRDG